MLDELERHGYEPGYGTLYPALHRMEEEGLLSREDSLEGARVRKYYAATDKGTQELDRVRGMIRELYREVVEGEGPLPRLEVPGERHHPSEARRRTPRAFSGLL